MTHTLSRSSDWRVNINREARNWQAQAKLAAFKILLNAEGWGTAGAVAEDEPEIVAIIEVHDKYVIEAAGQKRVNG